jgi:5-methylcytosine-specific restriction endonuclease McrA
MTLGDIRELYKDKSSMNVAAKVRGYGATIYRNSDKPKHCVNCGYSKFYEVCHIRAVKDFPGTATMSEVHSLDNLIALCPNCHWEFDHGMLTL